MFVLEVEGPEGAMGAGGGTGAGAGAGVGAGVEVEASEGPWVLQG